VLFGETIRWADWPRLAAAAAELDQLGADYRLSTGYVYGLLQLIDLATAPNNPESPLWRSRFAYRTRRYVVDKLPRRPRPGPGPARHRAGRAGHRRPRRRLPHPLFNYFYRQR
jgi:CRISPR-associated protein Csm1